MFAFRQHSHTQAVFEYIHFKIPSSKLVKLVVGGVGRWGVVIKGSWHSMAFPLKQ